MTGQIITLVTIPESSELLDSQHLFQILNVLPGGFVTGQIITLVIILESSKLVDSTAFVSDTERQGPPGHSNSH